MTYLQALILSVIQGIGEFLPISSSGHLILAREFADMTVSPDIDTLLHLATVVSILVVLWKDLWSILIHPKQYWPKILLAIIPAGLVGLFIDSFREEYLSSMMLIGALSIFWGLVFIWLTKWYKPAVKTSTNIDQLTYRQSLVIGLAQVLALMPGTSRSGVTTVAGVLSGVDFKYSLRFSFISGFPLIASAGLYGGMQLVRDNAFTSGVGVVLVALLVTAIIGIFALKLLTGKKARTVFLWSGVYRIVLGIVLLIISVQ